MEVDRKSFIKVVAEHRYYASKVASDAFADGARFADDNPDWRSPRCNRPEDCRFVLAFTKAGDFMVCSYLKDKKVWLDNHDNEVKDVELWMPIPKLPALAIQD
jgi:hypothetical protein